MTVAENVYVGAAGGVEHEVFAADVGTDVADVDHDAFDDVGNLIGRARGDADLRRFGVDSEREVDHDGAEVEGSDVRARDRDDRERRALERPAEVELAVGVCASTSPTPASETE